MKLSIKTLMCLALLSVIAVSCGKEAKKGGSSGTSYNPYSATAGMASFSDVQSWYNAAEIPTVGAYRRIESNTSSGTSSRTWGPFTFQFYSSGSSSSATTKYHTMVTNGVTPVYCIKTVANTACAVNEFITYGGKSANVELQNAMTGKNGALVAISTQSLGNGVYAIAYGLNAYQISHVYKIDTRLHSVYNPVEILDGSTGIQNYVQF